MQEQTHTIELDGTTIQYRYAIGPDPESFQPVANVEFLINGEWTRPEVPLTVAFTIGTARPPSTTMDDQQEWKNIFHTELMKAARSFLA